MSWITGIFSDAIKFINTIFGNYAWSVIVITLLIRLLMLPLDYKQKKSMRVQASIQPKIAALQKKYANDKEKLNQKTMELYKQEKFSPFSGCLPILIQFPIFIAFFAAIRAISSEQTFLLFDSLQKGLEPHLQSWLWVHNMWQPDSIFNAPVIPLFNTVKNYAQFKDVTELMYTNVMAPLIKANEGFQNGYFIMPILAGITSFFQGKMSTMPAAPINSDSPAPGANTNKMMIYLFPLLSVFFCVTSSAVFALYWTTSNIVSILFYLYLDRFVFNKKEKGKSVTVTVKEAKP